jgi:hypothetical protein
MKKSTKKLTPRVVSTKPLPAVGSKVEESAKIGGVSNRTEQTNYKKGG